MNSLCGGRATRRPNVRSRIATALVLTVCLTGCGPGETTGEDVGAGADPGAGVGVGVEIDGTDVATAGPGFECPEQRPGDYETTPDPLGDYVDVVRIGGGRTLQYWSHNDGRLGEADLGPTIGFTCFRIADVTFNERDDGFDGDATYLPVGTELRALATGRTGVRIGAVTDGGIAVYESTDFIEADTAADLIDFDAGLIAIGINDEFDGLARLATIDDPDVVERLATSIADTVIDRTVVSDYDGPRVFLEFEWADGTSSTRSFLLTDGDLEPAIRVEPSVLDALWAALDEAGVEPTALPGY